jgi:hypothetical protein
VPCNPTRVRGQPGILIPMPDPTRLCLLYPYGNPVTGRRVLPPPPSCDAWPSQCQHVTQLRPSKASSVTRLRVQPGYKFFSWRILPRFDFFLISRNCYRLEVESVAESLCFMTAAHPYIRSSPVALELQTQPAIDPQACDCQSIKLNLNVSSRYLEEEPYHHLRRKSCS